MDCNWLKVGYRRHPSTLPSARTAESNNSRSSLNSGELRETGSRVQGLPAESERGKRERFEVANDCAQLARVSWQVWGLTEAGRAGSTGGGPICTPGYAGLEQYQPERAQLKASTDVYSLGVMLYEVIAGCHPFLAWARGPRPVDVPDADAASVEAVLTQFPGRVDAPATNAESPAARGSALPFGIQPVAPPAVDRRWGVGDECVTMPAAFGRRAGYFDQAAALSLMSGRCLAGAWRGRVD